MPTAIVTDGLWRKSLSAVRSLGKAGYSVTVFGGSAMTTSLWSRYCSRRVIAPLAADDPDGFGRALLAELHECAARGERPALLPMEDPTLDWVSGNRDALKSVCSLLIPSREALATAEDKAATSAAAAGLGLAVPRSWTPQTHTDCARQARDLLEGGFVAKPRKGSGSAGIVYGERLSDTDWENRWRRFGPYTIQDRVPAAGRGLGVSALFDSSSRCVAWFAHERLRQYPVTGGPSTDRRAIHDEKLVTGSLKLLQHLGWRGIAMVEWKDDPRDGIPKLMEINPRFWGSLELAVRSGVDFPSLYARAASGASLEAPPAYPAGVRCRWMVPGELLRYYSEENSRREGIFEYLRGLPGSAEEWDRSDLRGTLATVACTAALALNPRYWKYVRRG